MNRLAERRLVAPRPVHGALTPEAGAPPETAVGPAVGPTFEEAARRVRARRRMALEIAVGVLLIVVTLLRPVVF